MSTLSRIGAPCPMALELAKEHVLPGLALALAAAQERQAQGGQEQAVQAQAVAVQPAQAAHSLPGGEFF